MAIPLVVPIIAAAVSALSAAGSAAKGSQAARKNRQILQGMEDENNRQYIEEYYRGALDNPAAKSYLKRLDQTMRDTTRATENTATATGATQENVQAAKQSNNRIMSDAIAGLTEREEGRKEAVRDRYLQRKSNLASGQMGMNNQVAQNWMTTGSNISSAAGALANAYLQSRGGSQSTFTGANPQFGQYETYFNRF
jgi:hypothetical protein